MAAMQPRESKRPMVGASPIRPAGSPPIDGSSPLIGEHMDESPRGRGGVVMAKESPEGAAMRRHREQEKTLHKQRGKHRRTPKASPKAATLGGSTPAAVALTPKPPPSKRLAASTTRSGRLATPRSKKDAAQALSMEEWLASLGSGCARYADELRGMGYTTVYALVEDNPRPEILKQGGIKQPSCRRKIWQATQRLQTQANYKRALRETMEPQLIKARKQARDQVKPRTPRVSNNSLHPVPLPTPIKWDDPRMSVKAHTARVEKSLGKALKLELTAEERLERQTAAIGKIIRHAISGNRSLNGKGMANVRSVFDAIDKDGSGELDHDEFRMAMNRLGLGLSEQQVTQCVEVLDTDRDGAVSLDEFMVLVNEPVKKAVKMIGAASAFGAGLDHTAVDEPLKLPQLPQSARAGQESEGRDWDCNSPRRRPKRDRGTKAERADKLAAEMMEKDKEHNQWTRGSHHSMGLQTHDVADMKADQQYVEDQLAQRKTERVQHKADKERYWDDKIAPAIKKREEQQSQGRWDTLLKRARNEQQHMRKLREKKRRDREEKARELLKDMSYVLEQTGDDAMSDESLEKRTEDQKYIEYMNNETRARRMDPSTLEEVRILHESMLKELFSKFDEDEGGNLDRDEIGALARGIGQKLTAKELDAAMREMDEDGGGEVDFTEFYAWWQRQKGKEGGALNIDTSAGGEPFTITIVRL